MTVSAAWSYTVVLVFAWVDRRIYIQQVYRSCLTTD